MDNQKIYIFALAASGQGISGSDRIFIEFAKRWSKTSKITIYVWEEGYRMCQRQELKASNIKYQISNMLLWKKFGFVINYFARIVEGVRIGLTLKLENSPRVIIYSASDFWMDSLPAFILKMRFPKIKWIAAWYQTAPHPLKGFAEGIRNERYYLPAFVYWLMQLPIKPIIHRFADFVFVNNEEERKQFNKLNARDKAIVVLGAVNTQEINEWKRKFKNLPKVYDGVFQGRFHPQKGVIELIDIWRIVVDQKGDAKLVMIGDGPLMKNLKFKISNLKLEKNIILTGYLFDGPEKYRIFSQSKLVVHPAFYDSGGMAAAEAMAFGLPAIGFDLKSYKSYYPQGMIKIKNWNLGSFAKSILELLNDQRERERIGRNALNMINNSWSWDKRSKEILGRIF